MPASFSAAVAARAPITVYGSLAPGLVKGIIPTPTTWTLRFTAAPVDMGFRMPGRRRSGNDHRRQSDWRKVSAMAVAVLAGGDASPLLERAMEGARLGKAELVGDVEQRHVGMREVLDR